MHNLDVLVRLCRAIVALTLTPSLVLASAMPQEHLHEPDADHPHALVHSHTEAHSSETHDHDSTEVSRHEEGVVWLGHVSLFQSTHHIDISWALVALIFDTVRDTRSWVGTTQYDASPPHGPPRACLSSRAPPTTSCLI